MPKQYVTFEEATELLSKNKRRRDLELFSMGMKQRVIEVSERKKAKTRYKWKVKTNHFVLLFADTASNIIYQTNHSPLQLERGQG